MSTVSVFLLKYDTCVVKTDISARTRGMYYSRCYNIRNIKCNTVGPKCRTRLH